VAAEMEREEVVAYLKRAADSNMLVCETVPLRIVVVSSGKASKITNTSKLPFVSHVMDKIMNHH